MKKIIMGIIILILIATWIYFFVNRQSAPVVTERFIPETPLSFMKVSIKDFKQSNFFKAFPAKEYKEIIKHIKDPDLVKKFMIGSKDQFEWMNKCNELRRDPAHPEKPCPTIEEVQYFEDIKNQILPRLL